ncbi:hypothetical protein SLA2020_489780 [Shorea laevis]
MLASSSRSLFRVDRLLKFSSVYVKSKPGSRSYYGLSCNLKKGDTKYGLGAMDRNKKRKAVITVWKPVSTQASSIKERIIKDVPVESGSGSPTEVLCSISNDVLDAQHATNVAEAVNEVHEKHSLSVEVGASIIRFIRGKEGATQKNIEEEMGVRIIFPSSKKEDSIVIEGCSIDNVTKASEKIQEIIEEVVRTRSLDYSHFVSLPLAIHPELVDKLVNFQNIILGNSDACTDEHMEGNPSGESSEDESEEQQLDRGSNVAVELKVEDNESVKVDISSIPLVSYAPKASKSPSLSDLGIEKSIFIKPKTFHLTVLMLKLWNKERVNAATGVLKSISSRVLDALDNRPVFIRLKGLDCMRGSLAKARVIYAPVEEIGSEDRLLRACQVIIDSFLEAGLVLENDAKEKLKLHATLMNARHGKRNRFNRKKKNDSFDARGIFKQFGSEDWGEYLIREAHLSQRFVFDENGYYHCCASIPFPENMQVD